VGDRRNEYAGAEDSTRIGVPFGLPRRTQADFFFLASLIACIVDF
jgi:hypothetical protein